MFVHIGNNVTYSDPTLEVGQSVVDGELVHLNGNHIKSLSYFSMHIRWPIILIFSDLSSIKFPRKLMADYWLIKSNN